MGGKQREVSMALHQFGRSHASHMCQLSSSMAASGRLHAPTMPRVPAAGTNLHGCAAAAVVAGAAVAAAGAAAAAAKEWLAQHATGGDVRRGAAAAGQGRAWVSDGFQG